VYPDYDYFPYQISFTYDQSNQSFGISTRFYIKPIIYPDKVLTPETITDIFIADKLGIGYDNSSITPKRSFLIQFVSADSIPNHNEYTYDKFQVKARLCLRPVYSESSEEIKELIPTWSVYFINDNYYRCVNYKPDTGVLFNQFPPDYSSIKPDAATQAKLDTDQRYIEQVFAPLGKTTEYEYDGNPLVVRGFNGYFDLPVPQDSVALRQNFDTIIQYLFKYRNLNTDDYSYVLDRTYYGGEWTQLSFRLCYQGFEIPGTQIFLSYQSGLYPYNLDFHLEHTIPAIPEFIITPKTAMSIGFGASADNIPWVWTEISAINGLADYFPKHVFTSEEEDYPEDSWMYEGSARLKIMSVKAPDSDKSVYKLVWDVSGSDSALIIDAVTGKVLSSNYWDPC
jgi:hypothetical protein